MPNVRRSVTDTRCLNLDSDLIEWGESIAIAVTTSWHPGHPGVMAEP